MTAFWKNLHLLTRGLLLNGGYLGGRFPSETTENLTARNERKEARASQPTPRSLRGPVATCR
jgi:hypothetical protein